MSDNCRFLHTVPESRLPQLGNSSGTGNESGPIFGIEIDSRSSISEIVEEVQDEEVEEVTFSVENVENASANANDLEIESPPASPEIPAIGLNLENQLQRHFAALNGYVSPWEVAEETDTEDTADFSFGCATFCLHFVKISLVLQHTGENSTGN